MKPDGLLTLQLGNDWFGERQGGLGRVYSELLKHLPGVGVEVRGLLTGSKRVDQETSGVISAFATPTSPLAQRLVAVRRAGLQILREGKTDLIASHFALYAFPLVDKLRALPSVIHFHGPWAAETGAEGKLRWTSKAQAAIEAMVYNRGRRLIVLSRAFGNELTEKYGVQEDRIRVIPGGIDTETFNDYISRHEARTRLGWPTDRVIVLAVRRHVRRMGLEALIDAAVQVSKQVPDVLFLLGGVGPISAELAQRTVDQGLAPHVKLIGRISDCDLPLAYRAADVSIVPSQALEGFGMITIESLASGTPVIVTPVGGLPEVVRPFAPECVLEGTGAEIIAATLTDFLFGRRKLPESQACRAYAMRNFSWPRIAAMTKTVYEEALQ